MRNLTQQIEELEREYAYEQGRANEFAEQIDDLNRDLAERDADLEWFRQFEEWVEETYPGARVAYEAKLRLDSATHLGSNKSD
jgi:flagellar biosynthesis chaperone FliJ